MWRTEWQMAMRERLLKVATPCSTFDTSHVLPERTFWRSDSSQHTANRCTMHADMLWV